MRQRVQLLLTVPEHDEAGDVGNLVEHPRGSERAAGTGGSRADDDAVGSFVVQRVEDVEP